jgi:Tfp pilus assembly protein PilO
LNETRKLIISIVVAIVVVAGLAVLLYFGVKSRKTLQDEIATKGKQVATLDQKIDTIKGLREDKEKLAASQQLAEEVLPDEEEVEELDQVLSQLEQQAEVVIDLVSRKVRAQVLTPQARAAKLPYERHTYTLKGEGPFFAFNKFLSLLETYKRFIEVDSFDIKSKAEEYPLTDFTVDISTFSYRATKAPATATSPQTGAKP